MEERMIRLETKVDHMQTDITELKSDVRKLNDKIDGVEEKLTQKIDSVKDSLSALALSVEKSLRGMDNAISALRVGRAFDRVWWLLMSAALLGIMARAFKWI